MANGCEREDVDDRVDESFAGESEEVSSLDGFDAVLGSPRQENLPTEQLTEALVEEGNEDLLMQALDFQFIGACRADERLKPLLKLNSSSSVAEDRLLAHLSQHFDPAEVGRLARCFCMPLVSIRVGRINKQGTLLCPATTRGNLNLTLLPTSDLRLSFVGDDGQMDLIVTLSNSNRCLSVTIEEISQDTSSRSFIIKLSDGRTFFFWCSEKSKLLGDELLGKMRDLVNRRPSIADLTGIDESRLESFSTYLRVYHVGTATCKTQVIPSSSPLISAEWKTPGKIAQSSSPLASISSESQLGHSEVPIRLDPKMSSSEEASPRCFLWSSSSIYVEEVKKQSENSFTVVGHSSTATIFCQGPCDLKSGGSVNLEGSNINPFSPGFPESIGKLAFLSSVSSESQVPFSPQPIVSSYYCWCPPGAFTSQELSISDLLGPSNDSPLLPPTESVGLADLPPFDFPAFLPDLPVSLPRSASQQIPTFTPLICDPIVHIPVIDICSTGQGYLVSAGPGVSTPIPPLHSMLVNPLVPDRDSVLEEGARETLRLLLSGSGPTNPPLMGVLPLPSMVADEKPSSAFVAGSRGMYCGGNNDDAIIFSTSATVTHISLPDNDHWWETPCSGDDNVNRDASTENPDGQAKGAT
ncbi:hypothetical protein SAY86_005837 [Trapa natans]|uniref:Uncharacterized protein n=1 Tax=Trapa natans TaxID=22666 RepID=A0AAN7L458_TRANT|nr:hypothetical protein SAY86_005837 [Trapa natans]